MSDVSETVCDIDVAELEAHVSDTSVVRVSLKSENVNAK